jgi:hypothetical protein
MYKSFAALALLATVALSGCMENGVNANCAAMGALAGGVLGAVTHNNVAQSAVVGGVGGAVAADQGYCR